MDGGTREGKSFELSMHTRVAFGAGRLERVGEDLGALGAKRVLVVTDAGLRRAGHLARLEQALTASSVRFTIFDAVHEDPDETHVEACFESARGFEPEALVALGGGSSIDTAKAFAFLASGGGRMRDYWGFGKARGPMLPLIAIPTTAGTGSEVQSYALVTHADSHAKMACGDPGALPRLALLDPTLTLSMPPFVTACSGLDTLAHAVETAVTSARNAFSLALSRRAFALAAANLERVIEEPACLEARAAMLEAAALAGSAIETSMLGAAHAMANPLSARYPIPHGQIVGMLLSHVVRFNAEDPAVLPLYATLARAAGLVGPYEEDARALAALVSRIETLQRAAGMPADLASLGVEVARTEDLAREAALQWTARFNPRPVDESAFRFLYSRAMGKGGADLARRGITSENA
jgi:alcohol dehydrogenase